MLFLFRFFSSGVEASRVLSFGDSLTNGYFNGGKEFHPYGQELMELLNKDDHRCFVVEISGKNGEKSNHMMYRLSYYLNTGRHHNAWIQCILERDSIVNFSLDD